jgi:hypothetical protein
MSTVFRKTGSESWRYSHINGIGRTSGASASFPARLSRQKGCGENFESEEDDE